MPLLDRAVLLDTHKEKINEFKLGVNVYKEETFGLERPGINCKIYELKLILKSTFAIDKFVTDNIQKGDVIYNGVNNVKKARRRLLAEVYQDIIPLINIVYENVMNREAFAALENLDKIFKIINDEY